MGYLTQSAFGGQPGTMPGNGRGQYGQYTLDALAQGQTLSPEGPQNLLGQLGKPNIPTLPAVDPMAPDKKNVPTLPGVAPADPHPRFGTGMMMDRLMENHGGGLFAPIRAMMLTHPRQRKNYLGSVATPNA